MLLHANSLRAVVCRRASFALRRRCGRQRHAHGALQGVAPTPGRSAVGSVPAFAPARCFATVADAAPGAPPLPGGGDTDVITTPIFYVNAAPHLGHLYTTLLCDARARWSRLLGRRVLFTTGTDEHGLKIEEAAERSGFASTAEFCDSVAESFVQCFEAFGISHDDFVRTTEPRHAETVHALWRLLNEKGAIYLGTHRGWYCKSDESYLTEAQTVEVEVQEGESAGADAVAAGVASAALGDTSKRRVSMESGHPVEYFEEQNFMFRLSDFQEPLLEWLETAQPLAAVEPATRRKEVLQFVRSGLQDFSISRPASRVQWGIPVPSGAASDDQHGEDEHHMIYVWLDALANYLTTTNGVKAGPAASPDESLWPASCQVLGKDILKFHAVYWPAFLLAAGLPLPQQLVAHGHWTVDGTKMSKSLGNVVPPADLRETYGVDAVRYFLLRDGGLGYDGDFVESQLVARVNSDLADTLGNLLSRCAAPKILPGGTISCDVANLRLGHREESILADLRALPAKVESHIVGGGLQYPVMLQDVLTCLYSANAYFSDQQPWTMLSRPQKGVTGDPVGLNTVLYITAETLRVCGLVLHPIVPATADTILRRIGAPDVPDVLNSGWTGGETPAAVFQPLHERPDVSHLQVEQGRAHLFTKLVSEATDSGKP